MSYHLLRKRAGSAPIADGFKLAVLAPSKPVQSNVSGGFLSRVMSGVFGTGTPVNNLSAEVQELPERSHLYEYHEGDLFTPGTGNYVFEPTFELPVLPLWGNAFLRTPNTFNPRQHPQVYSNQAHPVAGLGGLQAGSVVFQPLESDT